VDADSLGESHEGSEDRNGRASWVEFSRWQARRR
jgi:hypothetical protein